MSGDGAIAACAIVKNEGPGIAEWIAYHFAIGFSTVFVYDNRSIDDTRDVIDKMSRVVDVRRVDWPRTDPSSQEEAYNHGLEAFGSGFEWMFFLDADEFLLPISHTSIAAVMADFAPDVASVGFNWSMYGSSGLEYQPDDLLVIEAFRHHSEPSFPPNRHVKSAVRPARALKCYNAHSFAVDGRLVVGTGTEVEWLMNGITAEPPVDYGAARVNHYFTKSHSQWMTKVARGMFGNPDAKRKPEDFDIYDRNEIQDDRILEHEPAARRIMAAAGC